MFEANQADARDGKAVVELRSETTRELRLHNVRVHSKVSENTPANEALYGR